MKIFKRIYAKIIYQLFYRKKVEKLLDEQIKNIGWGDSPNFKVTPKDLFKDVE